MNVLRLSSYFPPEVVSSGHLTEDLYEAFEKNDIWCTCYAPQPTRGITEEVYQEYKDKKYEELYNGHVKVHRFTMFREGKNPLQRAIRYFYCAFKQYFKGIKAKDVDVVFSASTPPIQGMLSVLVAKKLSKKYGRKVSIIYNLQDIFPDSLVNAGLAKKDGLLWKIGRCVENYTYRNSDKIIVISESMKRNIMSKGVPENKIEVISNWIDTNAVQPIPRGENTLFERFNISRDKFVVLYAGNLGEMQGAEVIFGAAEQLKEYKDIQFVVLGGGAYFEKAKELSKTMDNLYVDKLLPLEYVSQVYSMGDVALITCKAGTGIAGMPSKTWSIMACNTSIIAAFDIESELNNILTDSFGGVCIPPENAGALANEILKKYKYRNTNISSRGYVLNHASKERCVNRYINIIKSYKL